MPSNAVEKIHISFKGANLDNQCYLYYDLDIKLALFNIPTYDFCHSIERPKYRSFSAVAKSLWRSPTATANPQTDEFLTERVQKRRRTMSNLYSVGQMNQLGDALEAEGFTPDDVTKLKQFSYLGGVLSVIRGLAKIKPVAEDTTRVITLETMIVVSLSASPKLPFNEAEVKSHIGEGWAIVEKRVNGLYVNGRKVVLYLSRRQQNGRLLKGYDLREELTDKPVLNANLLDALYDNPRLIPEEWKGKAIFFWGTIYRNSHGDLYVRCLCWDDGSWPWYYYWLGHDWYDNYDPAAVLASI